MTKFYLQYKNNSPVLIDTDNGRGTQGTLPLITVSHLISAYKTAATLLLDAIPVDELTLHFEEYGPAISRYGFLTSIQHPFGCYNNPLTIKSKNDVNVDRPYQRYFVQSKSDQEFIDANNLKLRKPNDAFKYLIHHLENIVDVSRLPNNAVFNDNCWEHRLDRRVTNYQIDNVDNIKLFFAVSGAGKTRMFLELLYSNFGYYFACKSSQDDFGSTDMYECLVYCDNNYQPELTQHAIQLLCFVRVSVCNYLISKGFKEPWQILLAQLHPIAFFGLDLFECLFTTLVKEPGLSPTAITNPFPFIAIDGVRNLAGGRRFHFQPESRNFRPFFTPLVYHSKMMGIFPHFLLSATSIDFELIKELVEFSAMKDDQITDCVVVSDFHSLTKLEVEQYVRQFLQDHQVNQLDAIVSRISAFELCHGRPCFISYILGTYMKSNDIDAAIGKFITGISNVDGQIFPLRFLKNDLDEGIRSFDKVIAGDNLSGPICDAFIDAIWKGKMYLNVTGNDGATAIRYGLGFGQTVNGTISSIEIQELAVIECLCYFLPFAHTVKSLYQRIGSSLNPNPQMVGYLAEYLVAFALVANHSGPDAANSIKASRDSASSYLLFGDSSQVCFPDHMCGPDIIYKCANTNTVYIVQVKFVERMSKQEAANAYNTTDPERFYCKRNGGGVSEGFEEERTYLLSTLSKLHESGYSLQQTLVIHTAEKNPVDVQGMEIINSQNSPQFFDEIGKSVWSFLDSVGNNLQ
ncbi:hypothetical protein BATDEDRAFT_25363 [Batrachochytrium dendrobatidis JAM81]|uniref:Uncharacterized protein n=1 Tax=Batrachochytrium dendrobatidis (strain JAM81 / FGSC 10211) TaxID=684364 RepID=F4P4V1_BATDJ|nr:uncharacterized protein BATDEDRAFT_25363 [Batrachochytrium dendrobatidis JAM81]EGF79670.1 hypothetical protein BATDEDRAFT_25363 [Batrachochytrium dendrobatidis JAM81]|eukprot:XP_006679435.1 hypothetical protein BATDEDRAFT_25363 [Batrachochytrium dendrobatidis JAM81]